MQSNLHLGGVKLSLSQIFPLSQTRPQGRNGVGGGAGAFTIPIATNPR